MDEIDHHIEKYIIKVLAYRANARFSDMRPPRVDSNLYSYHLKKLVNTHYLAKTGRVYTLTPKGLEYVDRLSMRYLKPIQYSKITTGVLVKNEFDEIILSKRKKQPFLGLWGLPLGKTYIDDLSIERAAERELMSRTGVVARGLRHVGDCYVRISVDDYMISSIFSHIFVKFVKKADVELVDTARWVRRSSLSQIAMVPGAREIIDLAFDARGHFFEELVFEIQGEVQ
ncbi:MAG: NUDIX domain-containing protein [Candidatus Nomurabacteria bacterium]|jgi:ADP-ribose pyrophosphatase YjhB (NUDIX family)|nr:NUDIX domain-containing protein [Candidatus Nomurabacteria bacterium]